MKIALCLLVALCVLSITMARGSGKGRKHGQGKHDDKPMDGPNVQCSVNKHTILPEKIWCQYQHLYNNTPSNVIVNVASNVSCRPLLEI
jgi:hypothetical protein